MRKRSSTPSASGVTIKDVAKYLGIAHSTVSRALHDHPYTNADTKHKVRQAAEKLGYVPNSAARSLRRDKGGLVGLILPDIQNDLFATAVHSTARHCLKAGLQLVLSITDDDPDTEYRHVTALCEARAAGVIINPTPGLLRKTVAMLERVPIVQYSRRHPLLKGPSASVDGKHALRMATAHLLQLGHRRIAYVGGESNRSTGVERLEGFMSAYEQAGLRPREDLIHLGPAHPDFAYTALSRCLAFEDPPTAVALGSGAVMSGTLRALRSAKLRIPDDISVVGFGDPPWYAEWPPGITTLGLPSYELAEAAVSLLMRQLRPDPAAPMHPEHLALEATFVLRGTTAPLQQRGTRARAGSRGRSRPESTPALRR